MNWHVYGVLFLGLAVLLSSIGVVVSKQETRNQFQQLVALEKQRDNLEIEWGQLQLEQSTWATHGRIEAEARSKLFMKNPEFGDSVMVAR